MLVKITEPDALLLLEVIEFCIVRLRNPMQLYQWVVGFCNQISSSCLTPCTNIKGQLGYTIKFRLVLLSKSIGVVQPGEGV